jgi:hypothetical protein
MTLRLSLARSAAWALLVAGWVGLGSFAMRLAPDVLGAFALVALWLLLLGAAAALAPRKPPAAWLRRTALLGAAAAAATGLLLAPRGGGLPALLLALPAWAALTALASGVVRSLRLQQAAAPAPPVGAAALGAALAALALGDPIDLQALALRLAALLVLAALLLAALQPGDAPRPAGRRCRAGLFDCSLPAWPVGAWRDATQWPTLLAGLAMLPMMASLPWMASWCRADGMAPALMVSLHLAAMFAPALLLPPALWRRAPRTLATVCAGCLAGGALWVLWAPPPWALAGLALAHGAAWGLAWAGQLWAPDRRSQAGSSPWRAALSYALLTLAFGGVVAAFGLRGVVAAHVLLGLAAALAWAAGRDRAMAAAPVPSPPAARPGPR